MHAISSEITNQLPFRGQFAITRIHSLSAETLQKLSDSEKQELEMFTSVKRRKEYVTSRILLKEIAQKMKIEADSLSILKDDLGQPYGMHNGKRFNISIAHTDEQVFCGISKEVPIGVDMEPKDREVPSRLKPRICHPEEEQLISNVKPIRLWTVKEAYIKLRGQGLRMNMNEVCLQQKKGGFFVEINNDKTAKICSFQTKGNWLAIAYYL